MKYRILDDNRAVSEIIGAILVFGLVVLSLVVFQTNAVPAANEEVEFDHNQEVQADLIALDAELSEAAASGTGGTAVVTVGTDYPTRFLFRNPPPVAGSLTTEEAGFTIDNAEAVDAPETADYWDGSPRAYDSNRLVYRVDYNVYEEAPTTVLAHGTVYDEFPGGTIRRIDDGGLIDGRTIDLAAVQGQQRGSRVGPVSVPVSARSAPTRTVRVTDDGGPVTLTLRTEAPADAWRDLLADQFVAEGGHVRQVRPGGSGAVEVVLEPGETYELQLASVAVGGGAADPDPHYVTSVTTAPATTTGEAVELTAEVRDRFNGPETGVGVEFSTADGDLSTTTARTDDDGRATVRFTPDGDGTARVTASADLDGSGTVEPREAVTFEVSVAAPGGGTGGSGGGTGTSGSACTVPDWSSTATSIRLENAEECTWSGVGRVDSLSLSNPSMTPLKEDGTVDPDKQYLRLAMVVTDGTTTYLVEVPDSKEGVSRQFGGGEWGNRKVHVYERTGDEKYQRIADVELTDVALTTFYAGGSLDLLDRSSYRQNDPGITELRNFVRNNDVSVRILENDGAVTLTAD